MYKLFNFYRNELSNYNLVYKHIKKWYYIFIFSMIILFLILMFIIIACKSNTIKMFSYLAVAILCWIIINANRKKVERIIELKYSDINENNISKSNHIYEYKKNKIKAKINELFSDNIDVLHKLKEMLESESDKLKTKIPVKASAFVVAFVPLWTQLIGWIFKNIQVLDEALKLFYSIFSLIIVVIIFIGMLKMFYEDIIIDIIDRDSYKMKQLARLIDEIILDKFE